MVAPELRANLPSSDPGRHFTNTSSTPLIEEPTVLQTHSSNWSDYETHD